MLKISLLCFTAPVEASSLKSCASSVSEPAAECVEGVASCQTEKEEVDQTTSQSSACGKEMCDSQGDSLEGQDKPAEESPRIGRSGSLGDVSSPKQHKVLLD